MNARLLVVISDRLSDLVRKGEVTARYYNPGDVFEEVHIVQINDDRPDVDAVQPMVGRARLSIHNIPAGLRTLVRSLGWRPRLLRGWSQDAVDLARRVMPAMVRSYGAHLNGFVAYQIAQALRTPFVVSLHNHPDEDIRRQATGVTDWLLARAIRSVENVTLRNADLVLPVYSSLVGYLRQRGITRFEVVHNMLNQAHLRPKQDYGLHCPVRIISVGRQFASKNPANLIRALVHVPEADLTVVGDGPYHWNLQRLAKEERLAGRVVFERAMSNDELCERLPHYDIFAVHNEYYGVPKAVMEAMLAGLPVVANRRSGNQVPELQGDAVVLVENTAMAYARALRDIIGSHSLREELGRRAHAYALHLWAPDEMEARVAAIYRALMSARTSAA